MVPNPLPQRYLVLRDRVLSGQADVAEVREFEALTSASEICRRDFVEYLHQESVLLYSHQHASGQSQAIELDNVGATLPRRRSSMAAGWLAASLAFVVTGWLLYAWKPAGTFRITNARNCQWAYSTVPITEDRPLGPGRLSLSTGIAVLELPQVRIWIEGGCDIEVISGRRCRLHQGRAYAEVMPGGEGFIIETPTSLLTDRGTAFTVNVSDSGKTDVKVVKGIVDVQHRSTGQSVSLNTSGRVRATDRELHLLPQSGDQPQGLVKSLAAQTEPETRLLQISTAVGNGRDCYVIREQEKPETATTGMLLVKMTNNLSSQAPWRRRAYLHFDLASLSRSDLVNATLHLEGVSSEIGFLSRTPDTVFAMYGLTDESQEQWDERGLTWENSPGFLPDHETIDDQAAVLLGRFTVPSARITDRFSIQGEALTQFLAQDTTGGATLLIVAETIGPAECWVHGFASRRHPVLTPPTLRLIVRDEATQPTEP